MTRDEFKKLLDSIAAESKHLANFQHLLATGNQRRLRIDSEGLILELIHQGIAFSWNADDPRTAVASLVAIGEYEVRETEILRAIASESRLILDIGANVGYYAVVLGKSLSQGARIFSFEPLPSSFSQLQRNVTLNGLDAVVTSLPFALSDVNGEAELHVPIVSGTSATSMRLLHPEESNSAIKVVTRKLDDVVSEQQMERVDLIKIDVEGAEWLALQGGWKLIEACRPTIFAELLRKWSAGFGYHPNRVLEALHGLGYKCFAVNSALNEISSISDETVETNFLFVHRDSLSRNYAHQLAIS
jgi:FkbM family methyltransferase